MAGLLMQLGAQAKCSHGGSVLAVPKSPKVLAAGQPVLTLADNFVIVGCPFADATGPKPCTQVQWLTPATKVLVGGVPALLDSSKGLAIGAGAPPTPLQPAMTQTKVMGE